MRPQSRTVILIAMTVCCLFTPRLRAQDKGLTLPLDPIPDKADLSKFDLATYDLTIEDVSKKDPPPKKPVAPGSAKLPDAKPLTIVPCAPSVTHAYSAGVCSIEVNRQQPGSPLPVVVPKGTIVKVVVTNRPDQENILFVQTTDAIPPPDYGLALVKLLLPVVPDINKRSQFEGPATFQEYENLHLAPFSIEKSQQDYASQELDKEQQYLDAVTNVIDAAKKDQAERFGPKPPKTQTEYDAHFDVLREQVLSLAKRAGAYPLPTGVIRALEAELPAKTAICYSKSAGVAQESCLDDLKPLQITQAKLTDQLAKVQAKKTAVAALREAIIGLPQAGDFVDVVPASSINHKAGIKISAKDVFSGITTDVATVTISWQGTNFSLSTGLLISTLPSRTFANTANVTNGVLAGGNTVTEQDIRPSYVTPTAMFNWEPLAFGRSQGFGIDLTVGLGANLTTKSADYAAGISLRIKNVFLTPVVDFGREVELSNGVKVGDTSLGTLSTVPTEQHFKPNFGFAISYRIPTP
jgi:hypothetical protein